MLRKLSPVAVLVTKFRQTRNHIVHEVASRQGSNALRYLHDQRKEAQQEPFVPRLIADANWGAESFADMGNKFNMERLKERGEALSQLKEWYQPLSKREVWSSSSNIGIEMVVRSVSQAAIWCRNPLS